MCPELQRFRLAISPATQIDGNASPSTMFTARVNSLTVQILIPAGGSKVLIATPAPKQYSFREIEPHPIPHSNSAIPGNQGYSTLVQVTRANPQMTSSEPPCRRN